MALTWKGEKISLTGTDTNFTTQEHYFISTNKYVQQYASLTCYSCSIWSTWKRQANILALGGSGSSGFKSPRASRWAGDKEGVFGPRFKVQLHFVDVAVVLCCNSIRNAGKGNTGFFWGPRMLIIIHHWHLNNLMHWKINLCFKSSTLWNFVFPACSIFAVGPFRFEDTLGEDDSINLANNIHFVFISCFVVLYFDDWSDKCIIPRGCLCLY